MQLIDLDQLGSEGVKAFNVRYHYEKRSGIMQEVSEILVYDNWDTALKELKSTIPPGRKFGLITVKEMN